MADDFDTWMSEQDQPRAQAWDTWPEAMVTELKRVIERNDTDPMYRIPLQSLLTRWREVYGVSTSRDTVRKYCKDVLKRTSFRQP